MHELVRVGLGQGGAGCRRGAGIRSFDSLMIDKADGCDEQLSFLEDGVR